MAQPLIHRGNFGIAAKNFCSDTWCNIPNLPYKEVAIYPWAALGKDFEVDTPSTWGDTGTDWSMDLVSETPYGIHRIVPTDSGTQYNLTFDIRRNPHCDSLTGSQVQVKKLYAHVSGQAQKIYETSNSWQTINYIFTARFDKTSIEFGDISDQNTNGCGPVLRKVHMVKV